MTVTLADGSLYEGQVSLSNPQLRHGFGKAVFKNGTLYEGEWYEGKIEGTGKEITSFNDVYIG